MLHPTSEPKKSYVEAVLEKKDGVFVAVSDYMKIAPDQIAPWVPAGLMSLGTDGFGRSDIRPRLRRFFEVDGGDDLFAVLYDCRRRGHSSSDGGKAIRGLNVDPEKNYPRLI
ncbi:MAG: transketolase-like TK C-terminal-containing protein [Candidatus Binatia bacterium]